MSIRKYYIKFSDGTKEEIRKYDPAKFRTRVRKAKVFTNSAGEDHSSYTPNNKKYDSKYNIKVGSTYTGKYTHYCACRICNGSNSGTTAAGLKIYNGMPNPYYVACNWAPLGTLLEITNKEGTHTYKVVDRGSPSAGFNTPGRVDIFTPEGHAKCYQLGTGQCTCKVLRIGN